MLPVEAIATRIKEGKELSQLEILCNTRKKRTMSRSKLAGIGIDLTVYRFLCVFGVVSYGLRKPLISQRPLLSLQATTNATVRIAPNSEDLRQDSSLPTIP